MKGTITQRVERAEAAGLTSFRAMGTDDHSNPSSSTCIDQRAVWIELTPQGNDWSRQPLTHFSFTRTRSSQSWVTRRLTRCQTLFDSFSLSLKSATAKASQRVKRPISDYAMR